MSAVLPMFTDADVRRITTDEKNAGESFYVFFQERCQALLRGIRASRQGFLVSDDIDYDTLGDVVTHLLDKGVLGFFRQTDDWGSRECIGIRDQMGGCRPYTTGYCPLPGQFDRE